MYTNNRDYLSLTCAPFLYKKTHFTVNKHNAEMQRADPSTKDLGQFSTRAQGGIFLHNDKIYFFIIPIVIVGEKAH